MPDTQRIVPHYHVLNHASGELLASSNSPYRIRQLARLLNRQGTRVIIQTHRYGPCPAYNQHTRQAEEDSISGRINH